MQMFMDVDTALSEVPVNLMPLIDDTDFKTRETAITYNQAGMDLVWNFVTTAGAYTQTAVTPTTGGNYDWTNQGDGMYSIEIPASGGASINNDTEGFGWFTGFATGVLPWRGPVIGFRAAGLNNLLIDDAFSATRGLAGTALPAAAADAAGGLPVSDLGGLDLDTMNSNTSDTNTKVTDLQGAGFVSATHSNKAIIDTGNSSWTGSEFLITSGTAQTGTTSSITLSSGETLADNSIVGARIHLDGGTGVNQTAAIDGYTASTKIATIIGTWPGATPDNTTTYRITPDAITEITNPPTAAAVADAVWDENVTGHNIASTIGRIVTVDIPAILTNSNKLGTPAGASVSADIAAVKAETALILSDTNAILVDTSVIGAAGAGLTALATQASVNTIDANVDLILEDTGTTLPGILGAPVGASLSADIAAVKAETASILADTSAIDTATAAIKTQTDKFTFTVANVVDANVQRINDVTILGNGAGTPFDV